MNSRDLELLVAVYLLKNRFNTPWDLVKHWAAFGPCIEEYPEIEKITSFD